MLFRALIELHILNAGPSAGGYSSTGVVNKILFLDMLDGFIIKKIGCRVLVN
jgi:hypothetical protein